MADARHRRPGEATRPRRSHHSILSRLRRPRRPKLRRPPFENRWSDGATAWRWYVELQRLGPDHVRACLAQQVLHEDEFAETPWAAPDGFVRDWLAYLERRERRERQGWRLAILLVALVAALGALIAAWPVVRTWL